MTRYKLDVEALIYWIREVNGLLRLGATIVVEGKNDLVSLGKLGINGRMITLHELKRSIRSGEDLAGQSFMLLFDFDEEGHHIHKEIKRELQARGAVVLDHIRKGYRCLGLPPNVEESYSYVVKRVRHWREIRNFSLR